MGGICCKVLDFVGVCGGVVELFGRARGSEVLRLCWCQAAFFLQTPEFLHRWQLIAEIEMLKEFEKDKLVKIRDDGFELTELGTHFSPQVCEVFDKYANRKPFNLDIPVVVEA